MFNGLSVVPIARSYDLASHVTGQTYPSNRTVSYSYGTDGRLSGFTGNLGDGVARTYADTMVYNAAGQLKQERFGTTTNLYHVMNYNKRVQMYWNQLGTSTGTWNRGVLLTYYSVTARQAGYPAGDYSGNNGNVWMQEHYVPTNDAISTHTIFRDYYEYDDLNRIKEDNGVQKDTAGNWTTPHKQSFLYDQWGNRRIDTNAAATFGANINNKNFEIDTATNRMSKPGADTCTGVTLSGMCYDKAGNQTFDDYSVATTMSGGLREYDGENRLTKANGPGGFNYYGYDADGQRIRRIAGGVEYWQVYGFDGELLAEYPVNGVASTPQKEYGYRSGQLLLVGGCDVARWLVTDHLGSPRIEVDVTGSLANVRRHDYLPFGEELIVGMGNGSIRSASQGYTADCVRQRFGSKERDTETGLDYFLARCYSSVQGRFTSADPLYIEMGRLSDPQQLNIYAYTRNNPLKYIDPLGLDITVTGSEQDEYIKQLQKKLSFQVQVNAKTHKVEIVGKDGKALSAKQLADLGKGLSGTNLAAFNAITDTANHATINTGDGKDDPSVFFGQEMGATHKIDFADLAKLDKAGAAINGSDVVLHETLEAYAQAKGARFADAHNSTLEFAPALGAPRRRGIQEHFDAQGRYTGTTTPWSIDGKLVNGRPTFLGFVGIRVELLTPIPRGAIVPKEARIIEISKVQ
jgi:RHS repeat-associated protein